MGTLVAGAPLLAGGPPGWLAYAALAVGTVVVGGAIYMSRSRSESQSRSTDRTTARTADCVPCRLWSVVTHAQGKDMGGTSGSTVGALPLLFSVPIPAMTGAAHAHSTYALLNDTQRKVRAGAFARALKWLGERPANGGFLGKKSFEVDGVKGGIRFDIDSYGPSNNFVT